jgi:Ca2+-binding RTX toxin-like protein
LRDLTEEIFPYHAGVAARNDLTMIMYEGGTHVSGHGPAVNDERLTAFVTTFNYTPEMAKLYEQLLNGWVNAGGKLFNAFVDVSPDTKWGSWGAKRYLEDQNPRWDMLMAYNAVGPNEWEQRDAKVFDQGITRVAGAGNQSLQGTSFEDVLIAGPGNDTLISSGGFDILHGGRGTDRAVLPGARDGYDFERDDGDRLMAKGPKGDIWLTAIEEIVFDAAPTQSIAASEF